MSDNSTAIDNGGALAPGEMRAARQLAASLECDEPAMRSSLDFGPFVAQGDGGGPRILIGDPSEIPLLPRATSLVLEHRMALLGRDGDVVALRAPDDDFLHYVRTVLHWPNLRCLDVGQGIAGPVARACHETPELLSSLARLQGDVTVQPFITTENAWRLAQVLGEVTGRVVHVSGPGPRLTRRVNDKLWFADLVRRVLGRDAVPPTMRAYGPEAAAALLKWLASRADQVVLKVPDSAGSSGNIRLESHRLTAMTQEEIVRFLHRHLIGMGWAGRYPLLVGVWDDAVVGSPSVQMWLPRVEDGPPSMNGVFEQRLRGLEAAFIGAERSILPPECQSRLVHEAMRVAAVLQCLGYYGPCSFDSVLVRNEQGGTDPFWIECNARWGGVSIPLSAAATLSGGVAPDGLVIMQASVGDRSLSTPEILAALEAILFRPGESVEGIVLIAPSRRDAKSELAITVLAPTPLRAERLMETALNRLDV